MATEKRLIDANALRKRMFSYYSCVNENSSKEYYKGETLMNYEVADMIEDCIDDAPTVDAVEVVRCKDCKHGKLEDVMYYRTVDGETNDTTLYRCYYRWNYSELNKGEHFCSYGERRTDV